MFTGYIETCSMSMFSSPYRQVEGVFLEGVFIPGFMDSHP